MSRVLPLCRPVLVPLVLVLVFAGLAAAPGAQPASPTRPHHPDIPYHSPASLGAASYAKILCSAVFVSGRDVEEARRNRAYFLMAGFAAIEPALSDVAFARGLIETRGVAAIPPA